MLIATECGKWVWRGEGATSEERLPQGPKTCNSNARPSAIDTDRDAVIDTDRGRDSRERERQAELAGEGKS